MRSITIVRPSLSKARQTKRAGAAALAALALTGVLTSSEAQAIPLEDDRSTGAVSRAPGGEIIGYDCTGRPITRFDTPPTWCPPSLPIGEEV